MTLIQIIDIAWRGEIFSCIRPGSYVAFLPCRIQFTETRRRLNRLPHFSRTSDWSCPIIRLKCDTDSNVTSKFSAVSYPAKTAALHRSRPEWRFARNATQARSDEGRLFSPANRVESNSHIVLMHWACVNLVPPKRKKKLGDSFFNATWTYWKTSCCIISLAPLFPLPDYFPQNLTPSSLSISVRHTEYSTFKTFSTDRHIGQY